MEYNGRKWRRGPVCTAEPLAMPAPPVGPTHASPRKRLGQTSLTWLIVADRRTHSRRCRVARVGGWYVDSRPASWILGLRRSCFCTESILEESRHVVAGGQ